MYFNRIWTTILFVFIIAAALNLTACGTKTVIKTVYETKTVYQEVDKSLTTPVGIPPPLDKTSYMSKPIYERESYLADYSVELMKSLHTCNAQLNSISRVSLKWKENADAGKQAN